MLGQILLTFITVFVGVNLVPSIADSTHAATHNSTGGVGHVNVTGASAALINLVPLFFILGIVITTIQSSVALLNKMGF
jgi:hypothetical protein